MVNLFKAEDIQKIFSAINLKNILKLLLNISIQKLLKICDRIKRGHVHFHKNHKDYQGSVNAKLKKFFKLNKKTYEKVKILENCLKIKINID